MLNIVDFRQNGTADTSRRMSPDIWYDCPLGEATNRLTNLTRLFDDFNDFPLAGTQTTQIGHGRYKVFNTGAGTVSVISAVNSVEMPSGILQVNLDTDNDSGSIAQAYPSFMLSGLTTNSGKLWFEARIAVNTILTNTLGFFLGLAEVEQWTLATGVPFNGGDAITNSASAIGFRKGEDALGVIDTVVSDRATSFTNIGDDAITTMTANTFMKLGLRYDPAESDNCIQFFCNNQVLSTKYSRTSLVANTNLDANALGLIFALVADSAGTSGVAYMDWWHCVQEIPETIT